MMRLARRGGLGRAHLPWSCAVSPYVLLKMGKWTARGRGSPACMTVPALSTPAGWQGEHCGVLRLVCHEQVTAGPGTHKSRQAPPS